MPLGRTEGVDQDCSVKEQNVLNISTACLQIICLHGERLERDPHPELIEVAK
uniref:Flavin-containing monooxygenase n=1 Tax=Oryza barthii TaxID=65489 RepID=A0A0D3FE50_9ORYZ